MVRRQLMQEYAQKSTTTTLPRRPSRVSGWLLSQPVAPSSGGKGPSVLAGPLAPWADIMAPPAAGAAEGSARIIIEGPALGEAAAPCAGLATAAGLPVLDSATVAAREL